MALAALLDGAPQQAYAIMRSLATMYGNTVVQNTLTAQRQIAMAAGHVTASQLNVRSEPIKDDNVVGSLSRGDVVQPVATQGPWLQVPHDGKQGFVWASWGELAGAPLASHDAAHAHEETQPHAAVSAAPAVVAAPTLALEPKHEDPKPVEVAKPVEAATSVETAKPVEVTAPAPVPAIATNPTSSAHDTASPPTTPTPHAIQDPKAATFETIQHTRVQVNHDDDGKVETEIRKFKHQFNPVWLKALQEKLSVGDATGAFNTETLRARCATRQRRSSPPLRSPTWRS